MYRLWETLLRPILDTVRPRSIVEIGMGAGRNTRNLAGFARSTDGTVHAVDPAPQCDVLSLERAFAPHLRVHRATSLEVIPDLPPFDAALIDGDHNWYTVLHELRAIARHAADHGTSPLILLHDTGWPYARRDLYYAPERIPEAFRKPHRRGGLIPGRDAPLSSGGQNPHLDHAEREEPRHAGVLGAIEDFLEEARGDGWAFRDIPGFHGLGILASETLLRDTPAFADLLSSCKTDSLPMRQLAALEQHRIELLCDMDQLRMQAEEAQTLRPLMSMVNILLQERKRLQDDLLIARREEEHLRNRREELQQEPSVLAQQCATLSAHLAAKDALIQRILCSRSWRWTAFLRRACFWLKPAGAVTTPDHAPAHMSNPRAARREPASLPTRSSH